MVSNTAATRVSGALGKKITRDIVTGFVIGIPVAYAWWYGYHVSNANKRDAWYLNMAAKKAEADE